MCPGLPDIEWARSPLGDFVSWHYALVDEYKDWKLGPIPDGWTILDETARRTVKSELKREVKRRHPLFGLTLTPVGTCNGCDDTLVFVEDQRRWALVHLTYAGRSERPPWPITRLFEADLPATAMKEHAEHVTDD